MTTATLFNIQRFSLHDGPGIRTTVFMKGCPLTCAWCHNPESMDPRPEAALKPGPCVGCEFCVPACELGLTARLDQGNVTHPGEACARCGACAEACPTGARELLGRPWSVEDLLEDLQRDAVYHDASTGGITFSGGEPLSPGSAPFVLACLEALKAQGRHTAVDTCGHVEPDHLDQAADLADLVLYDLKIMDRDRHRALTGRDNDLILRNLTHLLTRGQTVWIRVPLIPGHTADPDNLRAMAEFLSAYKPLPPVYLLPYHALGRDKSLRLGRPHDLPDIPALTDTDLAACVAIFADRGLPVQVGG